MASQDANEQDMTPGQQYLAYEVHGFSVVRAGWRRLSLLVAAGGQVFAAVCLLATFSTSAAEGLSYNPGTFPEFQAWQYTPGTSWAVGVRTRAGGVSEDIQYEFQFASAETLDLSSTTPGSAARGLAESAIGTNRAWASALGARASSTVISLWKDSFVISQDAEVAVQIHLDGTVPLIPVGVPLSYGSGAALYDFGVFRVSDGKKMAEFYTLDFQSNEKTNDVSMWLDKNGRQTGGDANQPDQLRVGGPEVWDITLRPYLPAGEYEFRSMLQINAATNDRIRESVVDFFNTASFSGIAVPTGTTLTSASGFLTELSPGVYGYPISSVPEPGSLALMLAGLMAVAGVVQRWRRDLF